MASSNSRCWAIRRTSPSPNNTISSNPLQQRLRRLDNNPLFPQSVIRGCNVAARLSWTWRGIRDASGHRVPLSPHRSLSVTRAVCSTPPMIPMARPYHAGDSRQKMSSQPAKDGHPRGHAGTLILLSIGSWAFRWDVREIIASLQFAGLYLLCVKPCTLKLYALQHSLPAGLRTLRRLVPHAAACVQNTTYAPTNDHPVPHHHAVLSAQGILRHVPLSALPSAGNTMPTFLAHDVLHSVFHHRVHIATAGEQPMLHVKLAALQNMASGMLVPPSAVALGRCVELPRQPESFTEVKELRTTSTSHPVPSQPTSNYASHVAGLARQHSVPAHITSREGAGRIAHLGQFAEEAGAR
ncbi:hypothetical protein FA95DRAFT_1613842 [Auriscalpium vulgare]|uniref:Uncharacterized protein n=1 Tax=Auriscalpium vulgare TaxID=40419 RepID=A0ACB8R1P4_9AGAM|nr:hypothetical protein FA95DRAFT_1613842 [Auriscalpium vulgare]